MAGLYDNIHAKRKRIKTQKAAGKTPERMRKVKDIEDLPRKYKNKF